MAFKKSFNKNGGKTGGKPFKKSFGGNGGNSFGKSDRGGARSGDRPIQMFSAVCAKCGKTCEVPFRPSPDRSVFCRDCFRDAGENTARPSYSTNSAHATRPTHTERPAHSSYGVQKPQSTSDDKRIGEIKWLIEKVENKVDSIIAMLEKQNATISSGASEAVELKNKTEKTTEKKADKKIVKKTTKKA